ncbi:hypothetical protein ACFQER_05635 [Halomicroarcula sp. GCM10025894]|uniref:hypothetical protein n=1 Tax=Halomicroarcula sp. GCM10025894 TaxID=3252673 RepID=UPI003605B1E6
MAEALIPTGHEAQSYVCLRSLSGHGVGSIIASEKPKVPAARSRYCSASVRVADPREDLLAYRDDLLAVARRPTVETVIPIRPEDSYVLSRYREQFESVTNVVVPTFEQLQAVIDRQRLIEVAATAGVPAPGRRDSTPSTTGRPSNSSSHDTTCLRRVSCRGWTPRR